MSRNAGMIGLEPLARQGIRQAVGNPAYPLKLTAGGKTYGQWVAVPACQPFLRATRYGGSRKSCWFSFSLEERFDWLVNADESPKTMRDF